MKEIYVGSAELSATFILITGRKSSDLAIHDVEESGRIFLLSPDDTYNHNNKKLTQCQVKIQIHAELNSIPRVSSLNRFSLAHLRSQLSKYSKILTSLIH